MILHACLLGVVAHVAAGLFVGDRYEPETVCKSEDCEKTAKRILDYMDPSTKPCEDFYRFSCGKFLKAGDIRDDEKNISLTQLNEVINDQLLSIIQAPPNPKDLRSFQILRNFTILCLKTDIEDAREVAERLSVLETAGGWPVLDSWTSGNWSLLDTLISLRQLGLEADSLFSIHVAADARDPSRSLLHIDQPKLLLSENKEKMLKAAILLGADPKTAGKQFRDAMLFESELVKIRVPEMNRRNHQRMYNPHTLEQLMDRFRWLDWRLLLSSVLPSHIHPSVMEVNPVIVKSVEYLRDLENILQKYEPLVIANYIMWNAAYSLTFFEKNMVQPFERMPAEGTLKSKCLTMVQSTTSMSLVLNSIYVKKYLHSNSKNFKAVENMVNSIAYEMSREMDELDWIDDKTRSEALHKLKKMKKFIGYPKELEDDSKIDELFEGFTLDATNFTGAMVEVWTWEMNKSMSAMEDSPDTIDWKLPGMVASMANAFYMPSANAMVIPAAIIQWPFYSPDVPTALNYGSIGMIMGHEISHGFDDQGSEYDSDGILRNWWKDSTKEMFDQKKKCYILQYGRFKNVNGTITQGENIADNAGTKLAFRAYRNIVAQKSTAEPALPGLEKYNSDQTFFLGMGNIWCSRLGKETMNKMTYDPHSPPEFRVNGVTSNLPAFAKAFECSSDTPMNNAGKCELW